MTPRGQIAEYLGATAFAVLFLAGLAAIVVLLAEFVR